MGRQMRDTFERLSIEQAEIVLPSGQLSYTISFFVDTLGFQLDSIMPADDPRTAQLSGHGVRVVFDSQCTGDPGVFRLRMTDGVTREALLAPNGTRIEFAPAISEIVMPPSQPRLCIQQLQHDEGAWKMGRAGMHYRDLIPDRQGGQFIASHIRIPKGGPVGDNVHHHDVRLQLIYCYRGWVRLVYEDQGEPFVMNAGDCVLQPPHIRHRVLASSDGLEVIEIGSPAEHMTHLDHQMNLPTVQLRASRDFNGQRFHFHRAAEAQWTNDARTRMQTRELGISAATSGLAAAQVVRMADSSNGVVAGIQDHAFAFAFVLEGRMHLQVDQAEALTLHAGDAFVIPRGMSQQLSDCSPDWQLLQVSLPG